MPCNAIATARASVKLAADVLTKEQACAVVEAILKAGGGNVIRNSDSFAYRKNAEWANIRIVNREWDIKAATPELAERLKTGLTLGLQRAAGAVMQEKIKQALAEKGLVTEAHRAYNGAMVINLEV
ncbi:MAG: hypothetical protein WCI88_07025 [Chloroflexota bacterium]